MKSVRSRATEGPNGNDLQDAVRDTGLTEIALRAGALVGARVEELADVREIGRGVLVEDGARTYSSTRLN